MSRVVVNVTCCCHVLLMSSAFHVACYYLCHMVVDEVNVPHLIKCFELITAVFFTLR